MKKNTKPKFVINIISLQKKYALLKKKKEQVYEETDSFFSVTISTTELKKRIQYILSLMSDFSTEISIKFCGSEEMTSVNKYYRGKNYPTDVLSFPVSEDLPHNSSIEYLGDILICLPICYNQAIKAKQTFAAELEKMIIHGMIHLKGFDHERNKNAWIVMNQLEKNIQTVLIKEMGKPCWCKTIIKKQIKDL